MVNSDVVLFVLSVAIITSSVMSLAVSVITLGAVMTLLRYARESDMLLDKIILVTQQLGKTLELAIWRG